MLKPAQQPAVIYLLRHGQTEHNASGRLMGHRDIELNDTGRRQAATAASLLACRPVRVVYSSDLARAKDTAESVAAVFGLEVSTRAGLREIDVGNWEGLTDAEIRENDPAGFAAVGADPFGARRPGGESYREMAERVWRELHDIAALHPGQEVVVVSHGGPMRAVICQVLGLPWERRQLLTFQNCGLLALIWDGNAYRLEVPGWVAEVAPARGAIGC
jgi:broad specificity phosphatase PhoE